MSGSAVHAAIGALVAKFDAVAPPDMSVIDGDPYDPPRKFLCVGWNQGDSPGVVVTRKTGNANMRLDMDSCDVACLQSIWFGKMPAGPVRQGSLTAFDAFSAALADDRRLGGAVLLAQVVDYDYTFDKRPDGSIGQVRFTVHLDSLQ